MAIFGFIKKVIMGEPLFDNQQTLPTAGPLPQGIPPAQQGNSPSPSGIIKGNDGTFPVVQVRHTETQFNGGTMNIYCFVRNNSPLRILLSNVTILGSSRQLNDDLYPNQEQQYLVYSGPILQRPGDGSAKLDYRTEAGDYFEAYHDVTYAYHSDNKSYTVNEVRLHPPIRDIYE